ncbi:MAG: Abi family protein [Christensenellales bacterium]
MQNNNVKPLKQPLNYIEQIKMLQEKHNLIVDDEVIAIEALKQLNYYRLCAYGLTFLDPSDKEKYIYGTSFSDLTQLYQFDFAFRHLLLSVLEAFEINLRSKISYHLAITYGSEGINDKNNFKSIYNKRNELVYDVFISNLQVAIERGKKKPFVAHHLKKYGGKFPVWASIELFSFGMLSTLFGIMMDKDQKAIAIEFGIKSAGLLNGWVRAFLDLRNRCAHNERIYNMPLSQPISLLNKDKKYITTKTNKVFPVVLALKRVTQNKSLWTWFCFELKRLFDVYPVVELKYIGFPYDWETIL